MDKTLASNQKRGSKKHKNKQPLKVVYFTNPIKFNATASEFRSLVQELTGQDADYARFGQAEGVGGGQEEAAKVAAEGNAHAAEKGSDLSTSASYGDDSFGSPVMIDNFEGLAASSLWHGDVHADVFKTLGDM